MSPRAQRGPLSWPLTQLTLARLREFLREPEAIFWVFLFPVLLLAARAVGTLVRDVVLTPDEVVGLSSNLLVSRGTPTAPTRFSEWLAASAGGLGIEWASELRRHYR